jgi:iron complex transport system permease protein
MSSRAAWLSGATLLVVAILLTSAVGAVPLGPSKIFKMLAEIVLGPNDAIGQTDRVVLWSLRAPRVVLACLVGASLGSAGAAAQGLFRNPLAEPGLVGVSAGASLGAALVIVIGAPLFAVLPSYVRPAVLPLAAFGGGVAVTMLVVRIGGTRGRTTVATVLLAGVAINALVGAFIGLCSFIATDSQLRDLTFWTLGGLGGATWTTIACAAPWMLLSIVLLPRLGGALDLMLLGEREARYLGVRVARIRTLVIGAIALGVGAAFSTAGLIGFVGLVVPHLVRVVVGPRHSALIPLSGLWGALLLVMADAVARSVVAPFELPVGILTASLGAPFFLHLLRKEARRS